MKKFADVSKDDYNAWYSMCREKNQPYIYATPKRKYAIINWEDGQYTSETHKRIDNKGDEIIDDMLKIFKKYAVKKSEYYANALVGEFRFMPIEHTSSIANELYDLLISHISNNGESTKIK